MTEKTITIEKVFEMIANTIFVLDSVSKDQVIKFLKEKTLKAFDDESISTEERIVQLVRYCIEAHDRVLNEIKTTEFIEK